MVLTRNTAARSEGEDQVAAPVPNDTVGAEENSGEGVVPADQSTALDDNANETVSMAELQRMVQELYSIHVNSSRVMDQKEGAKVCYLGRAVESCEAAPRKEGSGVAEDCGDNGVTTSSLGGPAKKREEFEVYPSHMAFKVYHKGLQDVKCKRVGDATFFAAKRAWERLVRDFPVTEMTKKRLLPHAFDGDARIVFEEVANTNLHANVDEMWGLLEERLCNEVHKAALQDRFFDMKWNERRESFVIFAHRLRSAALALPGGVKEDVLLNRLKAGLPPRLRDQANLISGSFDVAASRLSRLSTAAQVRGEQVREVLEGTVKKGNDSSGPSLGREEQFSHVTCYFCGEKGHIARHCEAKKAARQEARPAASLAGEGLGGSPPPAGSAPKVIQGSAGCRRK